MLRLEGNGKVQAARQCLVRFISIVFHGVVASFSESFS